MKRVCLFSSLLFVLFAWSSTPRASAEPSSFEVLQLLDQLIEMKDFQNPMTLKDATALFMEKFAARGQQLPILVDVEAFKSDDPNEVGRVQSLSCAQTRDNVAGTRRKHH